MTLNITRVFFLFLAVKSGGSIRGVGGNQFCPEGTKFFIPKVCLFMLFNDEISHLLLIKHVNFHLVKLNLSYFKIN